MSRAQERPAAAARGSLVAISRSHKLQTLIIAIPGVGTQAPKQWVDPSGKPWFDAVFEAIGAQDLGVFAYDHGINVNSFSWLELVDHGAHLLVSLMDMIAEQRLSHCPVILVGHSVGGFIAKDTLRLAYEEQHRHFIRSLAGVVLLGTPHSTVVSEAKWHTAALMVPPSGVKKKKRALTGDEIASLAKSSMLFEQAGIDVPVLSMFERRQTTVKVGLLPVKKIKVLIADEHLVRTGCSLETLLGVESDHVSLSILDNKAAYFQEDVCSFFKVALEDARLRIARGSPIYNLPSDLDFWSNTDRDEGKGKSSTTTDYNSSTPDTRAVTGTGGTSSAGLEFLSPLDIPIWPHRRRLRLPSFLVSVTQNRDFYGREDILRALDTAFFDTKHEDGLTTSEAKTFAICGTGGMGKTQIATQFAYSRKQRFDAVFWIRADSAIKVRDQFSRVALDIGLVEEDSVDARDQVILRDLVKGWLANPLVNIENPDDTKNLASWLLILDNVDDVNVLEELWPIQGPGCVIFTSRDPLVKDSHFLAADGVDLKPFPEAEASKFLQKLTNKSGDSRKVHDRLGGIPLAITQMASVIIRRDLSFTEFVESYDEEEERGDLLMSRYGQLNQSDYKKTVWSVWALENLKHSGPLLDVISMLDPDGIPEDIFNKPQNRDLLEGLPRTNSNYQRARTELLQSSLISRDNTSKRMVVHRLIQDAARSRLDPVRFRAVWSSALHIVSAKWPYAAFGWRHSITRWRLCDELLPHVMKLRVHSSRIVWGKETYETDLIFTQLLTEAAWYHHERGRSIESVPLFQLAKFVSETLKSLLEAEASEAGSGRIAQLDTHIAEIHYNFNCIACETNKPEYALKHGKIFNEMMRQQSGHDLHGKDQKLFISWNALGNGYMMNRMWAEGEQCFHNSVTSAQHLKSFKPTDMSFPVVNLGYAFWLTGRYEESVKMFMKGLADREAEFGVNDQVSFITGRFLHGLGNVKWSQALYEESLTYHHRALTHYEKTIGKNHHRTGDVHVRVADHYFRLRILDTAEKHLNKALGIFGLNKIYRFEFARALHRKSLLLDVMDKKAEATDLREKSVNSYRELFPGRDHGEAGVVAEDFDAAVAFWSR